MNTPRVAIITTMRNEVAHLLEWLAHHRAAGVDDVLVFSNDCTDGTDALLDALAAGGALTHLRNVVPDGKTPQWAALKLAQSHPVLAAADWLAVLDCDEFINLRAPLSSVQDLIAAVPDADAIVLPWRLFGNAGYLDSPEGFTTEAFTRAIPEDALYPALARFFKTLYRRSAFARPGVHRPRQKADSVPRWVDGSGLPLAHAIAADPSQIMLWGAPLATDLVQLNHYSLRAAHDFLLKRARGLPNHQDKPIDLTYWVERNFNTVADTSVERMLPATRAEHARLLALPGVAEAEAQGLARRRAALTDLLRDLATAKLLGRLVLAADSTPPDAGAARRLIVLFRDATENERTSSRR